MIGLGVNALSGGGGIITNPAIIASLLMHLNGTDASTVITDEYGKTCTAFGNAQIDTAQSMFGGASLELDGTGDYVTVADFADATPGSSDWLIECWVKPDVVSVLKCIASKRTSTTTNGGFALYVTGTGRIAIDAWNSAASSILSFSGATTGLTTTEFHHVGILKIGTKWGVLRDGTVDATGTETGTCGTAGTEVLRWGRDAGSAARDFDGRLDEDRIVKGAHVAGIYPNALTSLTYTVPTAPFEKG